MASSHWRLTIRLWNDNNFQRCFLLVKKLHSYSDLLKIHENLIKLATRRKNQTLWFFSQGNELMQSLGSMWEPSFYFSAAYFQPKSSSLDV